MVFEIVAVDWEEEGKEVLFLRSGGEVEGSERRAEEFVSAPV
jgi:hypothetical protein